MSFVICECHYFDVLFTGFVWYIFKNLFLPRVAEFIYIEGDNKRVCHLLEL